MKKSILLFLLLGSFSFLGEPIKAAEQANQQENHAVVRFYSDEQETIESETIDSGTLESDTIPQNQQLPKTGSTVSSSWLYGLGILLFVVLVMFKRRQQLQKMRQKD